MAAPLPAEACPLDPAWSGYALSTGWHDGPPLVGGEGETPARTVCLLLHKNRSGPRRELAAFTGPRGRADRRAQTRSAHPAGVGDTRPGTTHPALPGRGVLSWMGRFRLRKVGSTDLGVSSG